MPPGHSHQGSRLSSQNIQTHLAEVNKRPNELPYSLSQSAVLHVTGPMAQEKNPLHHSGSELQFQAGMSKIGQLCGLY
jgi:hypothetical protein